MRKVKVAATQMTCSKNVNENVEKAIELIVRASKEDANIVLIQELFENVYFCKDQKDEYFNFAKPFIDHPTLSKMSEVAKEYNVVLPISYFEKANKAYFNSVAIIDANGEILISNNNEEKVLTKTISLESLKLLRTKLPFLKDQSSF